MEAGIGSKVHPWYKGIHEWQVNNLVKLDKPIEYHDDQQGDVKYNPKILKLQTPNGCPVIWFASWLSTDKTKHKMRWGGGSPILEEYAFLELMKKAIKGGLFSDDLLKALAKEIETKLSASR